MPKLDFFKTTEDEFNFLNILTGAHYKCADIGEALAIKDLIKEGDAESGVQAYLKFGDTCKKSAEDCLAKGHKVSARDAYLRAGNYYFGATYCLDASPKPERFRDIWKTHRECWKNAANLMEFDYEEYNIPYEGRSLPGFFLKQKGDNSPRPLFIFNNGSDGSIIDMWIMGGAAAIDRGYNVLTFDGPGQGASLFLNNLYFRYDWEKVITPVIDSIIDRPEVDENNIVLLGVSQAGYWVPRAAAFEKRLRAIVADPGVVDVSTSWFEHLPKELISLLDAGDKRSFNEAMSEGSKESPGMMSVFNFRSRPYGTNDPFDVYTAVRKYNLKDVADKIECHTIITDPDDEQFWPGQSEELYNMLKCPKELVKFTEAEGANFHCEPKAKMLWEQRIFDRLDEITGNK